MLKLGTNIFALRLAMSFQKAALSNLGGVEMHKGDFRAHLQFRDEEGKNTHIRGPPRATEREAYADLEAIRASGGLGNTRGESLRIMMAEARQQKATADDYKRLRDMGRGSTEEHTGEFRADLQFRDGDGTKVHIRGPSRTTPEQAEKDLKQIFTAGSGGKTHREAVEIMKAEATKIKMSAEYQREIQDTLRRMSSKDVPNESDYEDDDASDHSEPPYLNEHMVDDSPEEDETPQKEQEHLTPIEATAQLSKFRPVISKPSELKYLLESKADPNMPVEAGNVTPLRNLMSFAPANYVVRMRNLLWMDFA